MTTTNANSLLDLQDPRNTAAARSTVLIVLNSEEMNLFLPGVDLGGLNSVDREYLRVDTGTLRGGQWELLLRELQPSVLVSAWSCPPIPLQWALSPDCPLRYLCHVTGSVRSIVPRELVERGLLVTNWGASVSHAVAEHGILLVLGALRNVTQWTRHMLGPTYRVSQILPSLRTRALRGSRVGLHGFGAVARCLVHLLKPFNVEVAAYSEPVPPSLFAAHGVARCQSLKELFARSDILIECESLTAATRESVTADLLDLLPDDAVFVNIARGAIVDEAALSRLAAVGRIRVGLDVYQQEPLPAASPLLHSSSAFLSPHIAGPTWEDYPCCGERALDNVARYFEGEPLEGIVTPEIYDFST